MANIVDSPQLTYVILCCSGTQGNAWKQGSFNLISLTDFKIMLEGTTTGGFQGDIALDDVSLDSVPCANSTTIVGSSKSCLFEFKFYRTCYNLLVT
ncbi:hypothetical protein DPMN_011722 [Dreissena polymorpha]|uniref:MAM domain-containing protein n=1 Tax=Dreissena polymorpha TaxID=45954 RepID=A0A9D4N148_DREPO|nr:hypothetical protein DPMN_011722 [Dreissena polymorpha]